MEFVEHFTKLRPPRYTRTPRGPLLVAGLPAKLSTMGKKGKVPSRKQQRTENRRAVRADRAADKHTRSETHGESTFLQRRLTPLEQVRGGRVLLGDDNEDLVIRLIALLELGQLADTGDALRNSCDLQDCFRLLGLVGADDAGEDDDDEYDKGGRSQLFPVQEGEASDGDVGNEDEGFVPFSEDETAYGGGVGGRASRAAEIYTSDEIDLEALLRGEDQSLGEVGNEREKEEGEDEGVEGGGGRYGPAASDSESSFDSDNDDTTTTIISPPPLSAHATSRAQRGLSVHQRKLLVRKIVRDARHRGRAGDNDYWHTPNAADAASAVSAVPSMISLSASRIITTPTTYPNEELSAHLKRLLMAHRAALDDDIDHITAAHIPAAALSRALLADTASLPIAAHKEHLLATIASNPVTLICGDTGSGKSTQVPKFVLQRAIEEGRGAECFIIVTQPRRIAAISLARRVAAEMGGIVVAVGGEEKEEGEHKEGEGGQKEGEQERGRLEEEEDEEEGGYIREEFDHVLGVTNRDTDTWGGLVGYQVRLCTSYGQHTRLLFVTTGTLLRRLSDHGQGQGSDDLWSLLSHVFIDEVHERQLETDFLLAVLKERASAQARAGTVAAADAGCLPLYSSLGLCPGPRLVLMSATMDEAILGSYFEEAFRAPSAICRVGGRCFPVKTHFIEEIEHLCVIRGGRERTKGQGSGMGAETSGGHVRRPFFCADLLADLVMRIIDGSALRGGQGEGQEEVQGQGQGQCILVFMSGVDSIEKVRLALRRQGVGAGGGGVEVLTLHGRMSSAQQSLVFRPFETATNSHTPHLLRQGQSQPQPLNSRWRVVLATNVAETSLTVPGVAHVIDTGLCKEVSYDAVSNLRSLKQVRFLKLTAHHSNCSLTPPYLIQSPCSQSSIKQRAGRAGRVCEGHYWAFFGEIWSGGILAVLEGAKGLKAPTTPVSDQDPTRTPSLSQVESTAPLCSLPEVLRVPLDSLLLQVLALTPAMVGNEGPVAFMQVRLCVVCCPFPHTPSHPTPPHLSAPYP